MILIELYGDIYEVSNYVSKHSGEGINGVYLRDYHKKLATPEFEKYHTTNESDEMLIEAKKFGKGEESGIYYVCPNFFTKRIPKYFHFLITDKYGTIFMENKPNKTFILRPSNSNKENSLSITYKNEEGELFQLKCTKIDKNNWSALIEDDEGEFKEITESKIEDLVNKIMIDNGYTGI